MISRRPDIQRAAEDERKPEDVVDLVRIVAAAGGDDRVVAHLAHFLRQNLGHRIGQREDDRLRPHRLRHLARHRAGDGESHEHVGADERVGQGARVRLEREPSLVRIGLAVATLVNHAVAIAEHDVLAFHAEPNVVLGRGDRGGAGAREDDANVLDLLADDLERVEQGGAGNDRRAVLVVVEDRDAQRLAQRLFDVETVGRANVLEVDPADRRLEELAELDDVVGILRTHLEIEHVEVGELLEEIPFAFHHGLAGDRPDVAEAEHRGAVGDDGDEVALGRVRVREIVVALDLETRLGHARRVGERQVPLVGQRLGRHDGDLARPTGRMVVERVLAFSHEGPEK